MMRRTLVLWVTAIVAVVAALVVHVALRFETVRLGYAVGDARREQRALIDTRRLLLTEAATLRQPTRIETIARGTLGMRGPDETVLLVAGASARPIAGRAE